jgi:tRNA pseudouridine synthase 10
MDVIEVTRDLQDEVCDSCLGRPFADRSFGLRNVERGRALRTAVALADDEPYETIDPEACWVCEGLAGRFDEFAERAAAELGDAEVLTYQVGTRAPPLVEENDRLLREEAGLDPDAGEALKTEFNREVGRRLGGRIDAEVDFERPDAQFLLDLDADEVEVTLNSVAVYGRYRKVERLVPQTEWPCSNCDGAGRVGTRACPECDGTGCRYETSVEQEVAPRLVTALRGSEGVFHGAGREDVDALMLGRGRPFVLEIKEPHRRTVDLAALEREIDEESDVIEVEGLQYATHDMVERVKELDASKTYRMAVAFTEPVDEDAFEQALADLDGATVEQRTPQRVDHRRADLVRTREVYEIDGELHGDRTDGGPTQESTPASKTDGPSSDGPPLDGTAMDGTAVDVAATDETGEEAAADAADATITVHGEGGLYVKELVSGDEGRTEPSLAELLGVDAEVTALDVLDVEGEEEPFEHPEFLREEPAES